MNSKEDQSTALPEFPVASVSERKTSATSLLQSRMWWITLLCAVLAAALAYQSLPDAGPQITIQFPQGHGLKAGDTVRYRGIDVGIVTTVALNETLTGVDVEVMLKPEGGQLNRDGTRFWIVRPLLSLTEISGLDTAVGAKYIGVSPGDPLAGHKKLFRGLPVAPPDDLAAGGLEVILRSDDRHGITVGAPVTWRGVDVGQVLSVGLSADARHVNTSVRIYRSYRRLVRPTSKFWITSGFGVDVGLNGISVNAQSLTTIARGGISFITLPDKDENASVNNGAVFRLESKADSEWVHQASTVPLIDFPLPRTVTVIAEDHSSILGIQRTHEITMTGLLIEAGDKTFLLTGTLPTNTIEDTERLNDFSFKSADGQTISVLSSSDSSWEVLQAEVFKVDVSETSASPMVSESAFRVPQKPEECVLVRTVGGAENQTSVIHAIDMEQLTELDIGWQIVDSEIDFQTWDGSAVMAVSDGKIIGLLMNGDGGPVIATNFNGTPATPK